MDSQEIDRKFEREEFKNLLKQHKNTALWDIVLLAVSLLCMVIISFAPCIEISGETFYKNYMQAYRQVNGVIITSSDGMKLVEGHNYALLLIVEKTLNKNDPASERLADDFMSALSGANSLLEIENKSDFDAAVNSNARQFSKMKLNLGMLDFIKILISESQFKDDGVGVFDVELFGGLCWLLTSASYFTVILLEAVALLFCVFKFCFNEYYTKFLYNRRYGKSKKKIKGGGMGLSFIFYVVFIIFYLCSKDLSSFFKDPARLFYGAVTVSPLLYVLFGVAVVVFIISEVNKRRKISLGKWMCDHA